MSVTNEIASLQKQMDDLVKENEHILAELQIVINAFKDEQLKRESAHAEVLAQTTSRTEKNKTKIETLQMQIDFAERLDSERGKEEAARKMADLAGRKAAFEKLRTTLEALGVESDVLKEYEVEAGYIDVVEEGEEDPEIEESELEQTGT